MSTVVGNPCCARSPVPSVILPVLCQRAADVAGVVGALTGRDVLSGESVGTEVTRLLAEPSLGRNGELVSQPKPCGAGPRRDGGLWPLVRGFGASLGRVGESAETSWSSFDFDFCKA